MADLLSPTSRHRPPNAGQQCCALTVLYEESAPEPYSTTATTPAARNPTQSARREKVPPRTCVSSCMAKFWLALLVATTAVVACGDDGTGPDCVEFVTVSVKADYFAVEGQRALLPCAASDSAQVSDRIAGLSHLFCYNDRGVGGTIERYPDDLPDLVCHSRFSSGRSCRGPLANPSRFYCWCPPDRVGRPGGVPFCESELET